MDLAQRRALLTAVLGFALLDLRAPEPPVVTTLKRWLGSWNGVGRVATGMRRHGYDQHLWCDEEGWRATFHLRSPHRPPPGQVIYDPTTPWRAVQRAAWYALRHVEPDRVSLRRDVPPAGD